MELMLMISEFLMSKSRLQYDLFLRRTFALTFRRSEKLRELRLVEARGGQQVALVDHVHGCGDRREIRVVKLQDLLEIRRALLKSLMLFQNYMKNEA